MSFAVHYPILFLNDCTGTVKVDSVFGSDSIFLLVRSCLARKFLICSPATIPAPWSCSNWDRRSLEDGDVVAEVVKRNACK